MSGSKGTDPTLSTTVDPNLLRMLRCPVCHGTLASAPSHQDDVDRLQCLHCTSAWPVRWGIPDLRPPGAGDPYLSPDEDLKAAARLVRQSEHDDFAGVLAGYYEANDRVPPDQARRFTLGALAAEGRARAVLEAWRTLSGQLPEGLALDVGCGTGPLAITLGKSGSDVIGIDVGMRWLVLAKLRARDAGTSLHAVCAHATRLPIAESTVDLVASEYLLENVIPAASAVTEAARVLRPEGRFWCTTANRWSVGPDPHLGALFAGWWSPERVTRHARRRGLVPPHRHLLDAGETKRVLAAAGFDGIRIAPAPVSDSQRSTAPAMIRLAVQGYRLLARTPPGRRLLAMIGPSLVVVARRSQAGPGQVAAS